MAKLLRFPRTRTQASEFERLLRPHVAYLYRLAYRFTGVVADAEDLVQDTLLKLYPRTPELERIEQLRPWLARVLYRQFIDFVRKRGRAGVDEDIDAPEQLSALEAGPEASAERGLQHARILEALGRLNPEQRAVVALHDIEGYRLEELEALLETPLGTLKSRLHRARRHLRLLLAMEPSRPGERVDT